MIILVQELEAANIQFKRLYLCSKTDPIKILEENYLDDFISYDDGVYADINDPFLLSYIYSN